MINILYIFTIISFCGIFLTLSSVIIALTYIIIGHSKSHQKDVSGEIVNMSKNDFITKFETYLSGSNWFCTVEADATYIDVYQCHTYRKILRQTGVNPKSFEVLYNILDRWCNALTSRREIPTVHEFDDIFIRQTKDKPMIIFGDIMKYQSLSIFHSIGLIKSKTRTREVAVVEEQGMESNIHIDDRPEIDQYLSGLSKSGSTYKLLQRMIYCTHPSTGHAYICKFSREHGISAMSFENSLCKVYSEAKVLLDVREGIVSTDEDDNDPVEDVIEDDIDMLNIAMEKDMKRDDDSNYHNDDASNYHNDNVSNYHNDNVSNNDNEEEWLRYDAL